MAAQARCVQKFCRPPGLQRLCVLSVSALFCADIVDELHWSVFRFVPCRCGFPAARLRVGRGWYRARTPPDRHGRAGLRFNGCKSTIFADKNLSDNFVFADRKDSDMQGLPAVMAARRLGLRRDAPSGCLYALSLHRAAHPPCGCAAASAWQESQAARRLGLRRETPRWGVFTFADRKASDMQRLPAVMLHGAWVFGERRPIGASLRLLIGRILICRVCLL